jgi:hypothetical protein
MKKEKVYKKQGNTNIRKSNRDTKKLKQIIDGLLFKWR